MFFVKSAQAVEKEGDGPHTAAKERSKSAQPIEKKRDENCTRGAKSEKEDAVEDGKAFGERGKRPDMGV